MAYEDIDADSREALGRASVRDIDNEQVRKRVKVTLFGRVVVASTVALLGVAGFNFLNDSNGKDDAEAGNLDSYTEPAEPTLEQLEQKAAEMLTGDDFDADAYQGLVDEIEELRSSSDAGGS